MLRTIDEGAARAEAALLDEAERQARQIRQSTEVNPDLTMDDAYLIQRAWLDRKLEAGQRLVGHKIGLTSRSMQAAMGITTPDSGFLTDAMVFEPEATLEAAAFCDPKLEIELAFVLSHDLQPEPGQKVSVEEVLDVTAHVVPAIELIAARSFRVDPTTGRTRTVIDTIADNAANAGIVCGGQAVGPREVDLRWIAALGYRNGIVEETGVAAGVLDHPAAGIAWLAQRLADKADDPRLCLKAGQTILAGSFTRPIGVGPGDEFRFDFGPLGCFELGFH